MPPKRHLLSGVAKPPLIPEELIPEFLSYLPVNSLLRFKSVCKSWNSLISEPCFVKQHLHRRSAPNNNQLLLFIHDTRSSHELKVSSFPIKSIMDASSTITDRAHIFFRSKNTYNLVGSCNGLICFSRVEVEHCWVQFWNPATRSMSQKSPNVTIISTHGFIYCGFGYDDVRDTYKILLVLAPENRDERSQVVMVFSMGDSNWRDIGSFPSLVSRTRENEVGVHLKGTLNWLAFHNNKVENGANLNSFMILSFDLNKEKYVELSSPHIPYNFQNPKIGVLGGCLCLSDQDKEFHNFEFWKMMEFGVDESWTKLFNIDYENLQPRGMLLDHFCSCFTWCMFDYGDVLMLEKGFLYNQKDNRLDFLEIPDKTYR